MTPKEWCGTPKKVFTQYRESGIRLGKEKPARNFSRRAFQTELRRRGNRLRR
jgi:hypothetical protein